MDRFTKGFGETIKNMESADLSTLREIAIKGIG